MNNKLRFRLSILIFLVVLTTFSVYFFLKEEREDILLVTFLNIGQGDAIFIETAGGNQVLIDGGPDKSVLRELGSVMPFYDRSIDVVIATHPDADHVGGLNDVLERYEVDLFMEPGVVVDTSVYSELKSKIKDSEGSKNEIAVIEARRGMVVELGNGVFLEILYPIGDVSNWESNDASIVAKLVYGETEFLLTGDAAFKTEGALLYLSPPEGHLQGGLRADVLKVGHHGSKSSTGQEFVKTVAPQYAVISSGVDNRYGHPAPEVLEILENHNVKILRTDIDGRIVFTSDGVNLKIK